MREQKHLSPIFYQLKTSVNKSIFFLNLDVARLIIRTVIKFIMNFEELEDKYQSLLNRIESIKKRPLILSHTVELLNQVIEFCSQKKKTNAFTIELYEQQSKNLDTIEGMMDGLEETLPSIDDLKNDKNKD